VQLYRARYISLGFHLDFVRPVLDLHIGWLIVALGRHPEFTPATERARLSCRGFLIEEPVL
jgi:hypothetical protein